MAHSRWQIMFPVEENDSHGPQARSGHRIVVDDNSNLYCYGGYNPIDPVGQSGVPWRDMNEFPMFRELWKFNLSSRQWHRLSTTGPKPKESASYACVLVEQKLLVLGGTGYPFAQVRSNKLYCCDLVKREWSILPCRGRLPQKVYGHSMTRVGKYIYLFGGTVGFYYVNEMYRLDLNTLCWKLVCRGTAPDSAPSPRYRHEVATDGHNLYVFGGGTSIASEPLSEIWSFDIEKFQWTLLSTNPSEGSGFPQPRKCHGCVQIGDDVYISGGMGNTNSTCLDDMWKFHIPTRTWTKLPFKYPHKIYFHAMTSSPDGRTIYNFGGVKGMDNNNTEEERIRRLSQLNISVKSLGELSWEMLTHSYPGISRQSHDTLINLGVPRHYLLRLDNEHCRESSTALTVASAS